MAKKAVVIGAGQGGLSAAIHAALRGWEVTVLERSPSAGGKAGGITIGDYSLDPGPSIIILTDIYRAVFEAAGRNMEDYLQFDRLDPFSRVVMEGEEPIDLPADQEACLEVLSRAAPEDAESLRLILKKLDKVTPAIQDTIFAGPIHQPWQLANPKLMRIGFEFDVSKTYRELVDGYLKSPLLRAFFYGFPSYNGQTYNSKAAGALMIPYLMIRSGVWAPRGGVAAIPAAFERLAKELGVSFLYGEEAGELVRSGKAIRAVRTRGGREVLADAVISNMDRISLGRLLGRPEPARPSFSYYTLHWGIRRRLPGLEHHTLLIPRDFEEGFRELYDQRRPPRRPIIYLNDTPAPAGKSCLFAVTTVPARTGEFDWKAESERLKATTRSELEVFGYGFADEELDFEREQTPLYFEEQHGSWRGSLYGPDEDERLWKLLPFRCRDEEVPNLFYAGGTVQPGAGLPMVTLSGKFAASLLPKP